ncbi:MAG TPA: PAS domain-containing protein, partial [Rubrivivax sp.]|nr:PAS domain-containing protein [Rubrivivax sp.]
LGALARPESFALDLVFAQQPLRLRACSRWLADLQGHSLVLRDVTSLHASQAQLRAEAGKLSVLAANLPMLIAYYDAQSRTCQFANASYARAFGFDGESIAGRSFNEVIGEEAAAAVVPRVDLMLSQLMPVTYERQRIGLDGSTQHMDVKLLPHVGPDGQPLGCLVLISDITPHRLAERALRESEERLAKFMHASAEGIVFHHQGHVTDANPPVCQLLGYSLDELLGRRTLDLVAPDQLAKMAS